jgi:hypothetical protein
MTTKILIFLGVLFLFSPFRKDDVEPNDENESTQTAPDQGGGYIYNYCDDYVYTEAEILEVMSDTVMSFGDTVILQISAEYNFDSPEGMVVHSALLILRENWPDYAV